MEFYRAAPLLVLIGCGDLLKLPTYLVDDPRGGSATGGAGTGGSATGGAGTGGSATGGAGTGGSATGGAGTGGSATGGAGTGGSATGGAGTGGSATGGAGGLGPGGGGAGGGDVGGGGAGPCPGATYTEAVACDLPFVYYPFESAPPEVLSKIGDLNGLTDGVAIPGVLGQGLALSEGVVVVESFPPELEFLDQASFSVEFWSARVSQDVSTRLLIGPSDEEVGWGVAEDQPGSGIASPPMIRLYRDTNSFGTPLPPAIPAEPWRHFVIVFDPEASPNAQIYFNGQLRASGNVAGSVSPSDGLPVLISNRPAGVASVDEVAIYTHPLSEDRIRYHYQCITQGCL